MSERANPVVRAASKRPLPEICATSSANTSKIRENTPVTNKRVFSLVHLSFKADVAPTVDRGVAMDNARQKDCSTVEPPSQAPTCATLLFETLHVWIVGNHGSSTDGCYSNSQMPICGQRMEISEPRGYSRAIREHMKSAHPENYVWSRRLRRMIIPLVVLIPVLAFTPAILEPELGYAPAFALSISGFIISLALIGFMARRALRKGQGALTPARLGDLPDTSSTPFTQASQSAVSYVAQDIVGTVKDLARKLEISGLGLDSVSWQDYFVRTGFSFSRSNRPVMVPMMDACSGATR